MPKTSPPEPIYPLTFEPVFKSYPWGGRGLATRLGRKIPDGVVAESWEISAHAHGQTRVAAGPLAGRTLGEVAARLGEDLVGRRGAADAEPGTEPGFPLLVKLLDAQSWLSVQVHPDDAAARRAGAGAGKTEMWVVLAAAPGARLLHGLKRGVGRGELESAIAAGRVAEVLVEVEARAGDVYFIPAGTVHALGPGLIVAEIQQSSDTTYRLFDWNRAAEDGRARELHVPEALEVIDFGGAPPAPVAPRRVADGAVAVEELVSCPHFRCERLRLEPGAVRPGACEGESFEIWGVLAGHATLAARSRTVRLSAVDWALLPAALGAFEIRSREAAVLLRVRGPGGDDLSRRPALAVEAATKGA